MGVLGIEEEILQWKDTSFRKENKQLLIQTIRESIGKKTNENRNL